MNWKVLAILLEAYAPAVGWGITTINGSSLALRSSGAVSGTALNLSSDGYLGTYVQLPSGGATVSFDLNAIGVASNSVLPEVTLSVAGTNVPFTVSAASNGDYLANVTLPGDANPSNSNGNGTYLVRMQLDNQSASASPTVKINSLTVTGATVSNSNTDVLALSAAQTYADKFRAGAGTITLTNSNGIHLGAGTTVQAKLVSNAFNFAAAVYGNSTGDALWIKTGANGQNLTPTTTEQIKYQAALLNPANGFNMIVPSNGGKWANNEAVQGTPTMNLVDAESQFAAQNNLRMRMHNLIWNSQQPSYINSMFSTAGAFTGNLATLNSDITSRINYYVSQGNSHTLNTPRADSYTEMDVLNEPFHGQAGTNPAGANYIGALGVAGVANVYSQVATAVAAAGANTRLYTNEYNVLQFSPSAISSTGVATGSDNYANWYLNGVQSFQKQGAPIGGIGMELYVNTATVVSAATMQNAMGNLSVAKDPNGNPMPLTLSEFGVANGNSPTEAKYDADMITALTTAYGNPQDTTFGFWGGVGGPHYTNNATTGVNYALYDSSTNYNITATGLAWQNWMSQYQTNVTLTTDANGNVSFNGTYGTYQVTVGGQNYTLNLVPGTSTYGLLTPIPVSTWNGNASGNNWSSTTNWAGSTFNANSALVFAGSTRLSSNNDTTAGNQYNGMTFNAGAGAFVITGNAINLGGDIVNNSANVQTINMPMSLLQNTNFNAAAGDLAIGGKISGPFGLTQIGSHLLTLSGANNYSGATTVTAGTLMIGASGALPAGSAVAVNGTSTMQLAPGIGAVTMASLTIATGARVDVTNNGLIIPNGDIDKTRGQLAAGFNSASGYWNGAGGIVSSTAAADSRFLTTLGYRSGGVPLDGVNTISTDVLVKYTYYGDADLNGTLDGADYQQIDNGFGSNLTGWSNGDFNYDGIVNGSDFALIDNAFNQITATGAAGLAIVAGPAGLIVSGNAVAVPEPVGLSILGFVAIAMLARRRRANRCLPGTTFI